MHRRIRKRHKPRSENRNGGSSSCPDYVTGHIKTSYNFISLLPFPWQSVIFSRKDGMLCLFYILYFKSNNLSSVFSQFLRNSEFSTVATTECVPFCTFWRMQQLTNRKIHASAIIFKSAEVLPFFAGVVLSVCTARIPIVYFCCNITIFLCITTINYHC